MSDKPTTLQGQIIPIRPDDPQLPMHLTNGYFLRENHGRCAALVGRVGFAVRCSAYDSRPAVCRVMVPGCGPCHNMRRDHHLETYVAKQP